LGRPSLDLGKVGGRSGSVLASAGVACYEMPQYGSFMKFKLLKTVLTHNALGTYAATLTWGKKF